jgi:hypothetical protein
VRDSQPIGAHDVEVDTVHAYGPRCRTCGFGIELRYGVGGLRSTRQSHRSHQDTEAGIAADLDHEALR